MIDLHCHILPGIDDGPATWDEALLMAEAARREGIRTIVATPHHNKASWYNDADTIRHLVIQLNERIAERGLDLKVLPGQEVHVNGRFWDEWHDGRIQAIGESRYVLIEFPFNGLPDNAEEVVHELSVTGYVPIIAHPERNSAFLDDPDLLEQYIQMGALGQLTTHSLCGRFGRQVRRRSEEMIHRGLVQIIASDAHGVSGRGFRVTEAYRELVRTFGSDCAEAFAANAAAVAENLPVDAGREWPFVKRRFFGW